MTRNMLLIGTVAIFGLTAAIAGAGDATTAVACDDAAKSAAVSASSCCAKGEAKSVSADAKKIRGGSYQTANVQTANVNAKSECTATAAMKAECASTAAHASLASMPASCTAGAAVKTASASGCDKSAATTAAAAGHDGCEKGAAAAAASGCCKEGAQASAAMAGGDGCAKSAAAGSKEACAQAKTASLKGVVDEMPYRESKKVVLTGAYACGHCQLQKTEECSPMLKTADGKVYPMLQSNHVAEIKAAKAASIQVTGVVKKVDGVKFIDVKSYKAI